MRKAKAVAPLADPAETKPKLVGWTSFAIVRTVQHNVTTRRVSMPMSFDRSKVSVNQEIVTRPAEHEVFLGFNGDDEATAFHYWLASGDGWDAFEAWVKAKGGIEEVVGG